MPTIKFKSRLESQKIEPCMSEPKLEFNGDKLYLYTPLPQYGEGIHEASLVMTKDIFQECYKRWIEPTERVGIGMKEIKCPCDLNQFFLDGPIFKNIFSEEECEQKKFYGDCYHCFATAIASRDHQLNASVTDNIMDKIKSIVTEWKADTWTDNLSYECMIKIAELVESGE